MFQRLFLLLILILLGCGQKKASEQRGHSFQAGEPYVRVENHNLWMSVKSFVPANGQQGPSIQLVGMVHVGEKRYYQSVQSFLDQGTLLFYEGIGANPKGDPYFAKAMVLPECQKLYLVATASGSASLNRLGLVNQSLVYPPERSVFADMGVEEFLDALLHSTKAQAVSKNEHDTKCMQMLSVVQHVVNEQIPAPCVFEGLNLLKSSVEEVLHQVAACEEQALEKPISKEQLANTLLENPSGGGFYDIILGQRNKKVLQALHAYLPLANQQERLVVVYGAAHMAEIERAVVENLGYKTHLEHRLSAFSW